MPLTSRKPQPITTEEFCTAIEQLLESSTTAELLAVPGLYELLAEEWNNEAIEQALRNREEA